MGLFLSEKARSRAGELLAYAAAPGAAMLVSPSGEAVLSEGAALEVDAHRIARSASARAENGPTSFSCGGYLCVHAAPIGMGWTLCIVSTLGMQPAAVADRLTRTCAVLALALVDRTVPHGNGGGPGQAGAPAEVSASRRG